MIRFIFDNLPSKLERPGFKFLRVSYRQIFLSFGAVEIGVTIAWLRNSIQEVSIAIVDFESLIVVAIG